jgi:hypothetical protein
VLIAGINRKSCFIWRFALSTFLSSSLLIHLRDVDLSGADGQTSTLVHSTKTIEKKEAQEARMAHRSTGNAAAEGADAVIQHAEGIVKEHMAK